MLRFLKKVIYLLSITIVLNSCDSDESYLVKLNDASLFNDTMQILTDVVVYDIFSPPVASRVYVYPTIAAYSIMQKTYPNKYNNLENQLSDFKLWPHCTVLSQRFANKWMWCAPVFLGTMVLNIY